MRRLYIGVLALLRIDAATIDAVRRTSNVAVFGASNASHAQHYAATFASLRCGGHADRFLFLDGPAPASAVALAAIGVHVIVADGNGAPAALARLGYETALYVAADVVAGPEFSCASLKVTSCVAEGDGVRAYDLRKGCEGNASLPLAWNHLARLAKPWDDERWRAWARNTAWPPTRVAVDERCGCGDLHVPRCAAGGCQWSQERGMRVVSPVSIKFTTTGDVAGLRVCFRVDGIEGGCVEAPAPMARSINYGFVTYPLYLRPGGHVVEAWLDSVVPSHDVVSSAFEVTAFCERDPGGAHPCNRDETVDQKGDVPFVAVAGCEGTGHALLRNLSVDEWERRATPETPLFATSSYPHSQPRDVERRPNFAVSKPDFIVVLWREPARAALSAARRFFRGGDIVLACDSFTRNADALFEQLFALEATPMLRVTYEVVVARPAETVRGLARFLGLDEPSVSGRVVKATAVNETKLAQARRLLAPRETYWEKSLDALALAEAADYATDEASTRAEIKKLTAELNEIGELLNQIAAVTEPDLFARGVAKHEAGDRDGAAEAWLAYLESVKDCGGRAADAHYNLGVYFDARGELEMAGRMYAGALTCAPAHESALQNAGANAINRGDAVSAVAFFERAYALNPSDVHASNLAVARERAAFVVDDDGK